MSDPGRGGTDGPDEESADRPDEEVPDWEDEYLDRVSDRLKFSFDLERDRAVAGRTFPMYGRMLIQNQKQLFHPAISYGYHESTEHLFVERADEVSRERLDDLVEFGHELADDWITLDEDHFETSFTFVVVVPEIPEEVRAFVADFRERTLLKFGYYGHYEIRLAVVAPEREEAVASRTSDVADAFRLWATAEDEGESRGLLDRLFG